MVALLGQREHVMHDTVIRGGTIVDGDRETPYTGDIAIDGGRISAVGGKAGLGNREIDADGLLVAPVWVDVKHPLRWTGYLGPDSGAFFLAWGNYSNVRELRCWICARTQARPSRVDRLDGGH